MAFLVEDGSGLANANAYVSVAYADAYHAERANAAWAAVSGSAGEILVKKQAAIIKATAYIEAMYSWGSGYKRLATQRLSWPRDEAYDVDEYAYEPNQLPAPLLDATAELALRALAADLITDELRATKREKVGEIEVEYEPSGGVLEGRFPLVDGMLRSLTQSPRGGGGSFEVVRG